ncbi:MAG TPA: CHAT domain-containing protein [Pyrinomonadaceae bacterium]
MDAPRYRRRIFQALLGVGVAYHDSGEIEKARESYEQAFDAAKAIDDSFRPVMQAKALDKIGLSYESSGDYQTALSFYKDKALPLWQGMPERRLSEEAETLRHIGGIYQSLGEYQQAFNYYSQAQTLYQEDRNNLSGIAQTLDAIGKAYGELGAYDTAIENLSRARDLYHQQKDYSSEAFALTALGRIRQFLGEAPKALNHYNQALSFLQSDRDKWERATVLNNKGAVLTELGRTGEALAVLNEALRLESEVKHVLGEAFTWKNIGKAYYTKRLYQQALDAYDKGLSLSRRLKFERLEAEILYLMALVESERGRLPEARSSVKQAIPLVESIRTKITSLEQRASYFSTVREYYELYIDLLMRLHKNNRTADYEAEALRASEQGRARSLLELLAESGADIRQGVDPKLLQRKQALQLQLNSKASQEFRLLGSKQLDGQQLEGQRLVISKEIRSLTNDLEQIEAELRQSNPRYKELTQPQPLNLKQIQQQVLDSETMLLEYSLGARRGYLWAVTPDSITSYELPERSVIEAAARQVYDLLNARNKRNRLETPAQRAARVARSDREIPAAAASLSQMVLAPVAAQLGKKRLIIVADGVLQYIPFAVLPDPSAEPESATAQPLIVGHEIVSLPSASTLSVIRREVAGRKAAPKVVAALADPVFMRNDERVKAVLNKIGSADEAAPARAGGAESVKEFELVEAAEDTGVSSGGPYVPRLPGSRIEAEEIMAMVPPAERKLALDFESSRDVATSSELSKYRYVHFSTHGFLNSVHPELSGLVFSLMSERGEAQDGFLRAHEIFNLKLPAELVVLSACRTGIGKEVKGEGLVSLTRGFMYAGAPRVVVSLWSVSDFGTTALMVRFYRQMLKEGKRPAEALRAAQISLMREKQWQSPFYWAAFTLQGEWR